MRRRVIPGLLLSIRVVAVAFVAACSSEGRQSGGDDRQQVLCNPDTTPIVFAHGFVEVGAYCHIGSSVVIGTVKTGEAKPGRIVLGDGVRVGDGTVVENQTEIDLVIPDRAQIHARSHVTNDGFGNPTFVSD